MLSLPPIQITQEFKEALELLNNPENNFIFITGKAGTGKTTLLKHFEKITPRRTVLTAPTGIAAINIGGTTLHSFFRLKPGNLLDTRNLKKLPRKTIDNFDTLIIDEASMLRADLLDAIDYILKTSAGNDEPFGGKQIILCGDLYQLPPVTEEKSGNELLNYFNMVYSSPYFFAANIARKTHLKIFELNEIFRQKEDKEYADLLNKIRSCSVTQQDLDALLNVRNTQAEPPENTIILTPTNYNAATANRHYLSLLHGKEFIYDAEYTESFENKVTGGVRLAPTEPTLRLKKGSKIMMLVNDKNWVNGDIGFIEDLDIDTIRVNIRGAAFNVERYTWQDIKYEFSQLTQKLEPIVKGTFTQYPLKLAWAITIHKSQGLTFDNIYLDIGNGAFASGQTYVALSRARTLGGVYLKKNIMLSDIKTDKCITDFFDKHLPTAKCNTLG